MSLSLTDKIELLSLSLKGSKSNKFENVPLRDKVDKLSRMSEGQTKLHILRICTGCPCPYGHRGEVVVRSLRTTTPSPDL